MADWFKFYENGIYESRFQWAIHEESGVCPVWLWILSECCKHKADHFGWKGQDYELFGASHVVNLTAPRVNVAINLLVKIGYISSDGSHIKVLHWNKFQSDYMRKLSKDTPDSVRTLSGQTPESVGLEERRGEEIRREESVHALNGKFVKPTADEVKGRFRELEVPESEYEGFLAYYDSNGWKVGRNPMKDWKSACVNWKKNIRGRSKSKDSFI